MLIKPITKLEVDMEDSFILNKADFASIIQYLIGLQWWFHLFETLTV